MRFSSLFVLAPIAISSANAQRQLSQDAQFDLIFPRHGNTYAPTQYFPIVFGIQNADELLRVLPEKGLRVTLTVWADDFRQNRSIGNWGYTLENFYSSNFQRASIPPAARFAHFIHFPPINMTNGTADSYYVNWNVVADNECNPQNGDLGNDTWGYTGVLTFSTAPGAQLPDIEASINSCPEPQNLSSIALNVKNWGINDRCPTFGTAPPSIECGYKPFAKDLAANVSTAMLREMGCDEGNWQTITAPCPRKAKQSGASWAAATTGAAWMAWVLAMASTF
ncbi:hypothetical protein RB595_003810 [Gaeumannomyces hyphopodioides]